MARRGMWLIGGMAVGVGALVLKPDTRTWLRRRLGMEAEDRRWFEEDDSQPAEHEGDEPLDTREARFSLRARLAEEGLAEPAATPPPLAAAPPPPPLPPLPPVERTPDPPPAFASVPPPAPHEPLASVPAETAEDAPIGAEAEVADPIVDEPVAEEPVAEEPAVEEPVAEEPAAEAPAEPEPAAAPHRPWAAPVAVPEPEPEPEPEPAPALAFESVPAIGPEDDAPKTPGEDTSEIEQVEETPYLTFQAPAVVPAPPAEDDEDAPPPPTPLRPPTSPASPPSSRPFSESTSFRSAIDAARERVHGAAREATPDEGESTEPLEERDS
jgi:hypothetical protein